MSVTFMTNEDKTVLEQNISQLSEEIDDVESLLDMNIAVVMNAGFYIGRDGATVSESGSWYTDYFRVKVGNAYRFEKTYLDGNRSICGYDKNKTFVACLATDSTETEITATIPAGVEYIRYTTLAGNRGKVSMADNPVDAEGDKIRTALTSVLSNVVPIVDTKNGLFVNNTGNFIADEDTITHILRVKNGMNVEIRGAYIGGSRSVCVYDDNMVFVKEIPTKDYIYTAETLYVNVDGFSYIAVGTAKSFEFSALSTNAYYGLNDEAIDELRYDDNVGNYIDGKIKAPTQADFESGYISHTGVDIMASTSYYHTPYIEVIERQKLVIYNLCSAATSTAHFYDEGKNYIGKVPGGNAVPITSVEITVPSNAKYMRYTVLPDQRAKAKIKYVSEIDRNHAVNTLVNGWYNATHKKTADVFKTCASEPIITFCDDDTHTIADVQRFHDACIAAGIKGSFACLTNRLESVDGLAETLLGYEREGFHVTVHGTNQSSYYLWDTRDIASCENDIVNALQKMQHYGFTDYKLWCTPYGVCDTAIQNLARKWGMECIISSGWNEYETTEAKYGRFGIRRVTFNGDDTGGVSLAQMKTHIDNAVAENGWVLVTTHMMEDAWKTESGQARFAELVSYAKNAGMKVKTLNEAFRIREPIYRLYEMF